MARVGIVYDQIREEERALIEAARRLGHEVEPLFVIDRVEWITKDDGVGLDVALIRCVSHYRALASSAILESKDVMAVNSFDVISKSGDKLVTTLLLVRNGVPVPPTVIAYSREGALAAAEAMGYPVIVKPLLGSWGRMIARANDADSLSDILEFRENMSSPQFKIHYIQKYVEKPGRDIRAFYVWGEVPVAIYRLGKSWKTNTARGAKAVPAELDEEKTELVIKAAEAVGGGVLGVDLMEDEEGRVYVSEVNGVVEFRNTIRVTGYDLAGKIVSSTLENLRR